MFVASTLSVSPITVNYYLMSGHWVLGIYIPVVLVQLRLFNPLVLGAPVLEPDLDLRLTEAQLGGQLQTPGPCHILGAAELHLEAEGLRRAKGGSLAPGTGTRSSPPGHWNTHKQTHTII